MAFERVKAKLGIGQRYRRYVDIESVRDLEDISDPETTEDETHSGAREWASDHPVLATILSAVLLSVGVVLLFYLVQFSPEVLTNIWTWRAVAIIGLFVIGYKKGWEQYRQRVSDVDELTLIQGHGQVTYKGVFLDDFPGRADGFIPIKGWRKGGHEPRPYTNADLGAAMVESFNWAKVDDDAAAVIRLEPDETEITHTDWGTRVTQRTRGLKPDAEGEHTTLHAKLPEYDDERLDEYRKQAEQLAEENHDLHGEIQGLNRRIMNLKDRLDEPIREEVNNRLREHKQLIKVTGGQRRRPQPEESGVGPRPRETFTGNGHMENGQAQDEVQQVEEELTSDDD